MPEREDGREWTAEAVSAWRAWWASPMMSTAWVDADTVALRRALRLVDDAARGRGDRLGLGRVLLDRLGLTPARRLRLQWLADPEPAEGTRLVALPARDSA